MAIQAAAILFFFGGGGRGVGKILIFFWGGGNRKFKKKVPTRHISYHPGAPPETDLFFFQGWPDTPLEQGVSHIKNCNLQIVWIYNKSWATTS